MYDQGLTYQEVSSESHHDSHGTVDNVQQSPSRDAEVIRFAKSCLDETDDDVGSGCATKDVGEKSNKGYDRVSRHEESEKMVHSANLR